MFIETAQTPNPQTLKFLPGRGVLDGARDFPDAAAAQASPLARLLFAVDGVERVYFGADFITVTKRPDLDWADIKPMILVEIMDHFTSGRAMLSEMGSEASDEAAYEDDAAEIVAQIKDLIETRVRPAVAQDGGDIVFQSWDHANGVVRLSMRGACAGCPSSTATLKAGIENMLKHYVPEVREVVGA